MLNNYTADGLNLRDFDVIVINTSGGKDSQAMMDHVYSLAVNAGVVDRLVALHANLGRVEWQGTTELAREQAEHYGIKFIECKREINDLLEQVEARGMFPDQGNRYCTSDQKRDPSLKAVRKLDRQDGKRTRVLNCMGFRAEESPARSKRPVIEINKRGSNGKREVLNWLPIHKWTVGEVWQTIRASGVRHHQAYDLGMPRLSCVFCIFAPEEALMLAGKHNPELLAEYVRVEKKIGHTFRHKLSLASIQERLASGEQPGKIRTWGNQ